MEINEYKEKIINTIKTELNVTPSYETLGKVESMIDFYSDVYKDENGFRPRADIGFFRSLYCEEAKTLCVFFDELPFEKQLQYLGY